MGTLNYLELLHYFQVVFEFTYDELWARRASSFASSRRNMPYCAASQAMTMRGGANQPPGTPAPRNSSPAPTKAPRREAGEEPPRTCQRS